MVFVGHDGLIVQEKPARLCVLRRQGYKDAKSLRGARSLRDFKQGAGDLRSRSRRGRRPAPSGDDCFMLFHDYTPSVNNANRKVIRQGLNIVPADQPKENGLSV